MPEPIRPSASEVSALSARWLIPVSVPDGKPWEIPK
jgi:hypothetical protein